MKRSCIDVGYCAEESEDPVKLFASMLREKYGGTEETEEYNRRLLENLVQKGQIAKSSIIWHQDRITKIYDFKVNDSGKIEYDIFGSHSKKKTKAKTYVNWANKVDISAVRNAILRSKQT